MELGSLVQALPQLFGNAGHTVNYSMTLTEQVLLHRDAQLLGMQVISESSALDQNAGILDQTSASARHGELGGEFRKLFNCKQSPLFNVLCVSSIVQKSLVPSTVPSTVSTTEDLATTSVPVSSFMSQVQRFQPASTS